MHLQYPQHTWKLHSYIKYTQICTQKTFVRSICWQCVENYVCIVYTIDVKYTKYTYVHKICLKYMENGHIPVICIKTW